MKKAIVALGIGQMLYWASFYYIFPATLLQFESLFSWPRAELTFALTLSLLVSAFLSPMTGSTIDKGYGERVLSSAGVLGGVCLFILPYSQSLMMFYGLWVILGIAMAGALYEPCFAIVTRTLKAKAHGAITSITLFAGFSGTISFLLANYMSENFSLKASFIFFACLVIL